MAENDLGVQCQGHQQWLRPLSTIKKKGLQYKIRTNCTTRAPATWRQVLMHSYAFPRVNDNPYTALHSCGYTAVLST